MGLTHDTTGRASPTVRTRVITRLARRHLAGPSVDDARLVADREVASGARLTLGPWLARDAPTDDVVAVHRATIAAIADGALPASLSIKLPDLRFDEDLLRTVLDDAAAAGVAVHLDSLRIDTVDRTIDLLRAVITDHPDLGCTLPGRWARSVRDGRRLLDLGVRSLRIVKGQWADPEDPRRDPGPGFLEVVDVLRAASAEVGVATHDEPLALEALTRLVGADTACRLEQLYGFPRLDVDAMRRRFGVGHLVYVPFGEAYLPYALKQVVRHPRILTWVARDLLAGGGRPGS